MKKSSNVVVVGGGFTGLSAAMELLKKGRKVTLLETEEIVGGLASGFNVGDNTLEKFYHHWFVSDRYIMELIRELGCQSNLVIQPSKTGMYYANKFYKLSGPLDLLQFDALPFFDRIRLGFSVIFSRLIKDWKSIEHETAKSWLTRVCGKRAYEVVWEPLLIGKFGPYADKVGAVWFWKKLALRGGSRSSDGREALAYYRGGFMALVEKMKTHIEDLGGSVLTNHRVEGVQHQSGRVTHVIANGKPIPCDLLIMTPSPAIVADILHGSVTTEYENKLRRIRYLANICLVLKLKKSLSDTYWLNVNDPSFPFVGIIEHTNFESETHYSGKHIVYLSKYLPREDKLYSMTPDELLSFSLPYIKKMFPKFDEEWIEGHWVWKADFAQPITEPNYSDILLEQKTPLQNAFISNMSQIYPEDRGTNYALREGAKVAHLAMEIIPEPRRKA